MIFLDCGDIIKGEVTLADFRNKIEVLSFNHGVALSITADPSNQRRTSGKPHHQDLTLTKNLDLATPSLVDYCNQSKTLPTVKLLLCRSVGEKVVPYMVYTLTNVLVSSISTSAGSDGRGQDSVTLSYSAITWSYSLQDAAPGTAVTNTVSWNLATNTAK